MAIASRFPDVEIPDRTLPQFVLDSALPRGEQPAIVDGAGGATLTYAELHEGVGRVAAGLAARGLRRGDVFAIMMPNRWEFAVAYYGALTAGGVVTTLRPPATLGQATAQLAATCARFLLTIPPLLPLARAAAQTARVEQVFVVADPAADAAADTVDFAELLASADVAPPIPVEPAGDLAVLLCSSATTGPPRVARLTHRAVVAAARQVEVLAPVSPSERLICPIPFCHLAGQTLGMNQPLRAGATVVIPPRCDLESFLALIQQHRVTTALIDPPIAQAFTAHPLVDRYDLSSLERILCTAAPLSSRRQSACARRMGRLVGQCYDEAETGVIVAVSPTAGAAARPGSVGMLVPNTQARVVDPDTGIDVGAGATGELWVRGPQLDGGWLRTGDLVRIDADGWIVIVDRLTR